MARRVRARRLLAVAVAALAIVAATASDDSARATAPEARPPVLTEALVQGSVCLPGTSPHDLNRLFDLEPAGMLGGDYQRAHPLPDGRLLWTFQDGAVRTGPDSIAIVHNVGVLQSGSCFQVLYGGTREAPEPFLFADLTEQFQRWFWPLDAELGSDGRLYIFVAEMLEYGGDYLEHAVPQGTRVAVLDPALGTIVARATPADSSASLYGWSITSDTLWTYLYAQCHRQFGFDEYAFVLAFDRQCSSRVTVGRVPRGQLLAEPAYWNGSAWTPDPAAAVSVVETAGRRVNANQIEWTGSSFLSVNKEGDWWGDTIYFARSEAPTGPFVVFATIPAPVKCPECNSFFADWIPGSAVGRPPSTLVFSLSHNRWDGVITAVYRPTFHQIAAPPLLGAGRTFRLPIAGAADLDAAVLNVTAVHPSGPGHVTVFPCDHELPIASNLNYGESDVVANLVIARPGPDGSVCLFSFAATDLVVDLSGVFEHGSGYDPSDVPVRLVDTRIGLGAAPGPITAGETFRVRIPEPLPDAAAINVTAVSPTGAGHITVFPCDRERPLASNLNYRALDVVANLVIVRPDERGDVCLSSFADTDLVIDLAGTFGAESAIVPADNPHRLFDSRTGLGGSNRRLAAGATVEIAMPADPDSSAVVLNVTAVNPSAAGHLTVFACDRERPVASNLNYVGGDVVANLVVVRPDQAGNVCVFTLAETDLVVDSSGSIALDTGFVPVDDPTRILDTRDGTGVMR